LTFDHYLKLYLWFYISTYSWWGESIQDFTAGLW